MKAKKPNGRPRVHHGEAEDVTHYLSLPQGERLAFKKRALLLSRANPGRDRGIDFLPVELLEYMAATEGLHLTNFEWIGAWLCELTNRRDPESIMQLAAHICTALKNLDNPPSKMHMAQAVFFAWADLRGSLPTKKELKSALREQFPRQMPNFSDDRGWNSLWDAAGLKALPSAGKGGKPPEDYVDLSDPAVLFGPAELPIKNRKKRQ